MIYVTLQLKALGTDLIMGKRNLHIGYQNILLLLNPHPCHKLPDQDDCVCSHLIVNGHHQYSGES